MRAAQLGKGALMALLTLNVKMQQYPCHLPGKSSSLPLNDWAKTGQGMLAIAGGSTWLHFAIMVFQAFLLCIVIKAKSLPDEINK